MAGSCSRVGLRLGDYRRVLLAALAVVESPVALLTVTAPGGEWDAGETRRWNLTAARRWGRLDRRVKGRLRREGLRVVPLARVAQRQRRWLDHLHVVLRCELGDRAALARYVELLKVHGCEYGFGFVDDPLRRRRNRRTGALHDMVFDTAAVAGRYLCRYLGDSDQLAAMVEAGDHSFRALWVAPELTRASGVNCRRLRRVRHAWHVTTALRVGLLSRLPVWWADIGERLAVLRFLRGEDRGPPVAVAVVG